MQNRHTAGLFSVIPRKREINAAAHNKREVHNTRVEASFHTRATPPQQTAILRVTARLNLVNEDENYPEWVSETPPPEDFLTALLSLRDTPRSPALILEEIPPPRQLAPWSAGLSMRTQMEGHQNPLATGRFVVLHDPDSQVGWNGTFRIVAQMRTQIDAEMSTDPLLCEALWNWAHDCLEDAGAGYHDLTGTVTKEMSESFGGLELTDSTLYVELRASWTPSTPYLGEHLSAWMELLCRTSGVTPLRHLEHI